MSGFGISREAGKPLTVFDEGVPLSTDVVSIDLVGSSVTGTNVGPAVTQTHAGSGITGPGSPGTNSIARWTAANTLDDSNSTIDNDGNVSHQTTTDSQVAWQLLNAAGDAVVTMETLDFDSAITTPSTIRIEPNGFNPITPSGSFIRVFRVRTDIGDGGAGLTQTNVVRGIDALTRWTGAVILDAGTEARSFNSSQAWNSTGAADGPLTGNYATVLSGGGASVAAGDIAMGRSFYGRGGFNTNLSGHFDEYNTYEADIPRNTDGSHTMDMYRSFRVLGDLTATGVTDTECFSAPNQGSGGYVFNGGEGIYKFGGQIRLQVATTLTTTGNVGEFDRFIPVDSSGGGFTVTIPTAGMFNGRVITFKDKTGSCTANNVTIATGGSETIDGSATALMDVDYMSLSMYSDGSNWFIF